MKTLKAKWCAWREQLKKNLKTQRAEREYEFLPAYLEVLEKPAAPWARRTAWALLSLLVLALIWSIVGKIDIHASAEGKVMVSSHSKIIQALEQGEVQAIFVEDGQSVKQGDVLIQLNPVGVNADSQRLSEQLTYYMLEKARMQALLSDAPLQKFVAPKGIQAQQIVDTQAHLKSEYSSFLAELQRLTEEEKVTVAEAQAKQEEIQALYLLRDNIQKRLQSRQKLAQSELIAQDELLQQERELLDVERQIKVNRAARKVLQRKAISVAQQKVTFKAKQDLDWRQKLTQLDVNIKQTQQDLVKAKEHQRVQSLRAPVDGVVQQLVVHTLGGVVQPAQALMVIVPEQAELEAQVNILNKDIGFVMAGQTVEIKIDSFPFTKYGTVPGEVLYVSRDAVEDEKLGPVFPARVRLKHHAILVDQTWVNLNAGMSLRAEIQTGTRRVIEYLLSPLQQYQAEALRER
tara:strand:- start:241 stop:1620 length:1380 start_codon:yes stop_codon:yes gene_type:complete